jgi:hypothetical protein
MRLNILVGTLFLVGMLGAGTVATSGDGLAPARQRAIAYLIEPTLIGSTIVQGPVLFTHDNAKMASGEPCTTVYLFNPMKGRVEEEIASFHCIPARRKVVHKFTLTTRPNTALGYGCVLTEYQFAGDPEGHGVPDPVSVLASAERLTETGHVHK